jgi:hypothetical protein
MASAKLLDPPVNQFADSGGGFGSRGEFVDRQGGHRDGAPRPEFNDDSAANVGTTSWPVHVLQQYADGSHTTLESPERAREKPPDCDAGVFGSEITRACSEWWISREISDNGRCVAMDVPCWPSQCGSNFVLAFQYATFIKQLARQKWANRAGERLRSIWLRLPFETLIERQALLTLTSLVDTACETLSRRVWHVACPGLTQTVNQRFDHATTETAEAHRL